MTCSIALGVLCSLLVPGTCRAGAAPPPFWLVAQVSGAELSCLVGHLETELAVIACRDHCAPIPWQLDERDREGQLALDQGAEPNADDPSGILDDDDEVLWMVEDGGRRMRPDEVPAGAICAVEVYWRYGSREGRAYAFAVAAPAPRSSVRYVDYQPDVDRMSGARVAVGFGASTPRYIAARSAGGEEPGNLLDRLKVRAQARFFGLIPLYRDEDDIQTELVAWRAGPIRITRRQRQWVRLGWGLRTPIFRSDTAFYRDYGILPVHLRLNFPPTYFFRGIAVEAVLDFTGLDGWSLIVPGISDPLPTAALAGDQLDAVNGTETDWFALSGPQMTLVQILQTGPTLATIRRQLVVHNDSLNRGPESVRGERPGVGYRLTRWRDVDRGDHWFASVNYALPPGYDPARFIKEVGVVPRLGTVRLPLSGDATPLRHSAP